MEPITDQDKRTRVVEVSKEWGHMELGGLKGSVEIDMFIALLKAHQVTGSMRIEIPYNEITKQLSLNMRKGKKAELIPVNSSRIRKKLDSVTDGMITMYTKYFGVSGVKKAPLFAYVDIGETKENTIIIEFNDQPLVRQLLDQLQSHSLINRDFYKLKSKYAKILYIMLKEFDNSKSQIYQKTGKCELIVTTEDFQRIMNVPESYKDSSNIWKRVINPAVDECKEIFTGLVCVANRRSTRGNPVSSYRFIWTPTDRVITPAQKKAIAHKVAGDYKPGSGNRFKNFTERKENWDEIGRLVIESQSEEDE